MIQFEIERTNCFLDSFLQNFLILWTIDGTNVRKKDNTINSEYYLVIVYRFLLCRSSSLADSMVDLDSRSSWMLVIDFDSIKEQTGDINLALASSYEKMIQGFFFRNYHLNQLKANNMFLFFISYISAEYPTCKKEWW